MWTGLIEYVRPITTSSTPSAFASRAICARSGAAFIGSAICTRRRPLRTMQRNTSAMTSSAHGRQEMKRLPVPIIESGVLGMAALVRRSRSHGSSRWKRTDTAMWVLEVKSHARKPTRSIVGAIARTSGVVRPVAPHSDWLPSRVVVSTISIVFGVAAPAVTRAPPPRASAS